MIPGVLQEPAIIALASGTFINNNGSAASLTAPSGAMYQERAVSLDPKQYVGKTLNPQQFTAVSNSLQKILLNLKEAFSKGTHFAF